MNEELLKLIKSRMANKQTPFNGGIMTADRYAKTLLDCAGSDLCYQYAAKGQTSFDDVLKKCAGTLTYNNEDMVISRKDNNRLMATSTSDMKQLLSDSNLNDIELPKNTLVVFKHTLTTPRKDRDGDILRTEGAQVDPKMLLLWQHVHTLPIGKMLSIVTHNSKTLDLITAIIDMNTLAHDAAVMVDNDMGRFSHGFRALEFETLKEEPGNSDAYGFPGFDIKEYEIMEESLVSVPSNTDADTQEVIISMVDGGKFTSPIMKQIGQTFKETKTAVSSSVKYREQVGDYSQEVTVPTGDFEKIFNTVKGKKNEEQSTETKTGCKCGGKGKATGTPKETDANDHKTEDTDKSEMMLNCESCGALLNDGHCPKCGKSTKSGRVLSAKNLNALKDIKDGISELLEREDLSKGGQLICHEAVKSIDDIVKSAEPDEDVGSEDELTVERSMTYFIAKSNQEQQKQMLTLISGFGQINEQNKLAQVYRQLFKKT